MTRYHAHRLPHAHLREPDPQPIAVWSAALRVGLTAGVFVAAVAALVYAFFFWLPG